MDIARTLSRSLLENTFTKGDFLHRIELLKEFFESIFYQPQQGKIVNATSAALMDFLKKSGEDDETIRALAAIENSILTSIAQTHVYSIFNSVKDNAGEYPCLTIYAPIVLTTAQKAKLGRWARENIGSETMLSLHLDPKSVGGCMISWENKYYDFSLNYFIKQKEMEIIQLIRTMYGRFQEHNA